MRYLCTWVSQQYMQASLCCTQVLQCLPSLSASPVSVYMPEACQ